MIPVLVGIAAVATIGYLASDDDDRDEYDDRYEREREARKREDRKKRERITENIKEYALKQEARIKQKYNVDIKINEDKINIINDPLEQQINNLEEETEELQELIMQLREEQIEKLI